MDNIKFEDLLEKIINENDDDVEVCKMVEECKEEEEKKKQSSILTTSGAVDYLKYTTEDNATIYTSVNKIMYQYPDGRQFVIDTNDVLNATNDVLNANAGIWNFTNSISETSNVLGTIADSTDGTIPF